MKRINVAVGILEDAQGRVLVGQRTVKDAYFNKWEFPGGKLEQGESAEQALVRELSEELGVDVKKMNALTTIEHDYPDRHVKLMVFRVTAFDGVANGLEDQALRWLYPTELHTLDFLQGNTAIVDLLIEQSESGVQQAKLSVKAAKEAQLSVMSA